MSFLLTFVHFAVKRSHIMKDMFSLASTYIKWSNSQNNECN